MVPVLVATGVALALWRAGSEPGTRAAGDQGRPQGPSGPTPFAPGRTSPGRTVGTLDPTLEPALPTVGARHGFGPWRLEGRVVDGSGAPVADARVHLGQHRLRATEDGTFTLEVPARTRAAALVVWAPGRRPSVASHATGELQRLTAADVARTFVLADGLGSLAGRVVDEAGAPAPGALVGLLVPSRLEDAALSLEGCVAGRGTAVNADAAGHFRIDGLLAERVRLRVYDSAGPRVHVTEPLAVGTGDVTIVLPSTATGTTVTGRVDWPDGRAPRSVRVAAVFDWLADPRAECAPFQAGHPVEIDEARGFRLEGVPRQHALIEVQLDDERFLFPVGELDLDGTLVLAVGPGIP